MVSHASPQHHNLTTADSASDGAGWTKVRSGGDEGFIPTSYFESIAAAPTSPFEDNPSSTTNGGRGVRPESTYSASSVSLAGSIANSINAVKKKGPAVAPRRGAKKLKYVEALYAYDARGDSEHSIAEGERLVLIKPDEGDGWAEVEKGGVVKSVPAAYVKEV